MIVPGNAPPKEKSEEERRKELLDAMKDEPFSILSLAYTYAKTFNEYGEDITKRWKNVAIQTDALNRAYQKGWKDCIEYKAKERANG